MSPYLASPPGRQRDLLPLRCGAAVSFDSTDARSLERASASHVASNFSYFELLSRKVQRRILKRSSVDGAVTHAQQSLNVLAGNFPGSPT